MVHINHAKVRYIWKDGQKKRIIKYPKAVDPAYWGIYQTHNKNRDIVPPKWLESSDDDDDTRSDYTPIDKAALLRYPFGLNIVDDPEKSGRYDLIVRRTNESYRLAKGSSSDAIGAEGKLEVHDPVDLSATRPENGVSVVGSPCDPLDEDRRLEEEALRKVEEKIANKKKQTSIVKSPARIHIKKKKKTTALFTLKKKKLAAMIGRKFKKTTEKEIDDISRDKMLSISIGRAVKREMGTIKKKVKRLMKSYMTKEKESARSVN